MVNISIKPGFRKNYCGNHGKPRAREDHKKKKNSIDEFDRRLDTVEERTSWKTERLVEPI